MTQRLLERYRELNRLVYCAVVHVNQSIVFFGKLRAYSVVLASEGSSFSVWPAVISHEIPLSLSWNPHQLPYLNTAVVVNHLHGSDLVVSLQ